METASNVRVAARFMKADEILRVGPETAKLGDRLNELEEAFNRVDGKDIFSTFLIKKSKNADIRGVSRFLFKTWWPFIGDRFFERGDAAKEFVASYDEGASGLASIQGLFRERRDQARVGDMLGLAVGYKEVAERFIRELPKIKADIVELYDSVNWEGMVLNPAWAPGDIEKDKRKFQNLIPYAHSLKDIRELKFILRSIIDMHRKH